MTLAVDDDDVAVDVAGDDFAPVVAQNDAATCRRGVEEVFSKRPKSAARLSGENAIMGQRAGGELRGTVGYVIDQFRKCTELATLSPNSERDYNTATKAPQECSTGRVDIRCHASRITHHASRIMRTTIDIDDPILKDLKRLQRREGKSLGRLVSDLLALALATQQRSSQPAAPVFKWIARRMHARVDLADKDALLNAMDDLGR